VVATDVSHEEARCDRCLGFGYAVSTCDFVISSLSRILIIAQSAVIAAIIRLVYMSRMIHEVDITWVLGPAQIWTSLEPSLGIVSACLITTFRPILRGFRTVFRLKDHSKVSISSDHDRRTIGSMGLRKVPHPSSKKERDDEEELMPCYIVGGYMASVTAGTSREGVQGLSQQDVQKLMRQEWQNPLEKGTLDEGIQVETSFVVEKEC
jgi:hypothetical protein